jgi:hypothetical protein
MQLCSGPWRCCALTTLHDASVIIDNYTYWTPPPDLTQQVVSTVLLAYTESPLYTASVIFTPRVLQRHWSNISRFVDPIDVPSAWASTRCGAPVVALLIRPHVRSLPLLHNRLDSSALPTEARWHRQQAESLRVGCRLRLHPNELVLSCHFASTGFPWEHSLRRAIPCHTKYHLGCIRAGIPFQALPGDEQALQFPQWRTIPLFVCEACSVRAQIQGELTLRPQHIGLLLLERMRLTDVMHHWDSSTLTQYDSNLNIHCRFLQRFSLPAPVPRLDRPPRRETIILMWSLLHYSLRCGQAGTVKFGTVRQLRSARSAQETWMHLLTSPDTVYATVSNQLLSNDNGRLTDTFGLTVFTKGLENRLGNDEVPATALTGAQIRFMDHQFNSSFALLRGTERRQTALAALVNVLSWTAWLRASEVFGLRWCDITIIRPADSLYHGLPANTGALLLQLAARTKSSSSRRADVVVAATTHSGLSPLLLLIACCHNTSWHSHYWSVCFHHRRQYCVDFRVLPSKLLVPTLDFGHDAWRSSAASIHGQCSRA